jgi:hypothetical protein
MPRRNRNAHAFTISADELAAQADQLTAEIGTGNNVIVYLTDEIQLYSNSARSGARKSSIVHDYLFTYINKRSGCQVSFYRGKAVTSHGRN